MRSTAVADSKEWEGKPDKLQYFSPNPGAGAQHTYKYSIGLGGTWHIARPSDQTHVFREGTISRWWRIEFSQLPSGRDGRVLCSALPKALQLQQPSTLRGHRGCCACTS